MNKNVLVIDDDKNILDSYREILSPSAVMEAGLEAVFSDLEDDNSDHPEFSVQYADQGETGYRLARKSLEKNDPIAVAFIDMRMPPGWDGLETAKTLRKLDDRIYIVIVTAYADKSADELQDALRQNILLLRKPFIAEEIYQLARNLCNSWTQDEALKLHQDHLEELVKQRIDEIRTLQSIIPICSYCKNIRDDEDAWHQMEVYMEKHTHGQFSHGICPDCLPKVKKEIDELGD